MTTVDSSASSNNTPSFPQETVHVSVTRVSCDGGKTGGLGHPKIYLDVSKTHGAVCPYCGKTFIYVDDVPDASSSHT